MAHLFIEALKIVFLDLVALGIRSPIAILHPDSIDNVLSIISWRIDQLGPALCLLILFRHKLRQIFVELVLGHLESYVNLCHV